MLEKTTADDSVCRFRQVPLRLLLVVPFLLQIFAAVGLVGYLSFKNGQKAVNDLANQLIDKASQQVDEHLDNYLALPQQLNQINANAIASGRLNVNDPRASEQYFWSQARAFKYLSYVGLTLPDGRESGAGRWIDGVNLLVYENLPGAGLASDYLADDQGNRVSLVQSYQNDPLSNSWDQETVRSGKPAWTQIAIFETNTVKIAEAGEALSHTTGSDVGLNYYVAVPARYPLYDQEGKLRSLLVVDLLLTSISEFLNQLQVSPSGQVFIMERNGLLIGSSSSQPILHQTEGKTQRYSAIDSPNLLIQAVAQQLQRQFPDFHQIPDGQELEITFEGQRQFVQATSWQDEFGLDWVVVVVVPEADFMAQIDANTRTTIALCLGALAVAAVLGIYTSKWITQPILRLSQVSESIAAGKLDQTIDANGIKELDAVAESFNHMAQQLQDSFHELEAANADLETRVESRTAELTQALAHLQQTQTQLIQTEKMSSLGQLVAGVAHEINNPVNFIHGNLAHTESYAQDLLSLIELYQQQYPQPTPTLQMAIEANDLDFLKQDFPKLLSSMRVGAERIREIVKSLRNFSRLDEAEFKAVDIHEGIDSTLLILRNRLKQTADSPTVQVTKCYSDLPLVECYPGQLNQVFMNLLSNAIDALEEHNHKRNATEIAAIPSTIQISTERLAGDWIAIRIVDNGVGMREEVCSKLFDPFFTTKPIGKGTGLGLSISYQIITEKHRGRLYCHSALGRGAEFVVEIPIYQIQASGAVSSQ